MGYEFVSWNENDLICTANTFWIRYPHNQEMDSFELEMYPCPNMKYKDLETDQDIISPEKYYVSEGRKHDSAILFFQNDKNDENDKVYPEKYINNIVFEELTFSQVNPEYHFSRKSMRMEAYPDKEIIEYAVAQTIRQSKLFLTWNHNRKKLYQDRSTILSTPRVLL